MNNEYSKQQMVLAFEYGYVECEKGHNIQKARERFLKDLAINEKCDETKRESQPYQEE